MRIVFTLLSCSGSNSQIREPPSSGSLRRISDHVDCFTAEDLRRGLVRYDHEAQSVEEAHVDDRFIYVVCVQSRCVDAVLNISVQPGNTPTTTDTVASPTFLSRPIVVDGALGFVVVTPDDLNTSCVDCFPFLNITYTVTLAPKHGRLERRSENEAVTSFSQRDLDLGHVIYRHVDSDFLSDSFQLSASRDDDVIWSAYFRLEIDIRPSGDEVMLSVVGNVSVVEGERAFVTENQLSIQHGSDVDNVEIVVVRLPVCGRIQVIGAHEIRAKTAFLLSEVQPQQQQC